MRSMWSTWFDQRRTAPKLASSNSGAIDVDVGTLSGKELGRGGFLKGLLAAGAALGLFGFFRARKRVAPREKTVPNGQVRKLPYRGNEVNGEAAMTTQAGDRDYEVLKASPPHWVGDGFYVRSLFMPHRDGEKLSPFLLLDYGAPREFEPSLHRRGVGEHPHRGFETVTFAYQGEVSHRDSSGGGGTIAAGDVQWMTAGSGVVHEEFLSQAFSQAGGTLEMVQLWVDLPKAQKMTAPRYQPLRDAEFPRVKLGAATARLVAGELNGQRGPAKTFSELAAFDLSFDEDGSATFEVPAGHTATILNFRGELSYQHRDVPRDEALFFHGREGKSLSFAGKEGTKLLVLHGKPLEQPVAAYGPFVMNTQSELMQAMEDYRAGKMGRLSPREGH